MIALKLAVVGDPVAHSRSPEIFTAMLAQAGLAGTYEAIRVPSGAGARTFTTLRDEGYTGLNVTTPLKVEALEAADTLDDIARAAGSVNLLLLGDRLAGYNTDGAGALGALASAGLGDLERSRVLILGAGPTARAATLAIRSMGARVDVWNRTQARADEIVSSLGAQHYESDLRYDAILSTLLPGVEIADVDAQVANSIASATIVIDANYGSRSTLAQNFNRESVIDGFEMLHASARASFSIFTRER